MENKISNKLYREGLIKENEFQNIQNFYKNKLFSLHWELKTLLYLGVLLLSTGAGLIIYQNMDSISHQAILLTLAMACAACFYFCKIKKSPYSPEFVESASLLYDYLLLLGCLLFLSFEGYFQYKYQIFGEKYGLAVLLPGLLFIFLAYSFDHKGVLSMGITGIAGWIGISASPYDLLSGDFVFSEMAIVWTGLGFGILTVTAAFILEKYNIKKHFIFTYLNFAANVLFFATLAGLFMSEGGLKVLFTILLAGFTITFYLYAKREHSFYFLLISSIYGYIGFTYLLILGLIEIDSIMALYLGIFYFIGSCAWIIYFFFNYKKLLKI